MPRAPAEGEKKANRMRLSRPAWYGARRTVYHTVQIPKPPTGNGAGPTRARRVATSSESRISPCSTQNRAGITAKSIKIPPLALALAPAPAGSPTRAEGGVSSHPTRAQGALLPPASRAPTRHSASAAHTTAQAGPIRPPRAVALPRHQPGSHYHKGRRSFHPFSRRLPKHAKYSEKAETFCASECALVLARPTGNS